MGLSAPVNSHYMIENRQGPGDLLYGSLPL